MGRHTPRAEGGTRGCSSYEGSPGGTRRIIAVRSFAHSLASGGGGSSSGGNPTVTDCSGSPTDIASLPYVVAHASSGGTVTFGTGLSCSPILLTNTLTISQNLTITGPEASLMAVSGGGTVGVLQVNGGTVTISGLTIENGHGSDGGGISNHGTLIVNASTVSDNSAPTGDGGGIFSDGALTIGSSTLSDNSTGVGRGGGLFLNGGYATITDSTISGNSAHYGTGIYSSGNVTIIGSTIADNLGYGLYAANGAWLVASHSGGLSSVTHRSLVPSVASIPLRPLLGSFRLEVANSLIGRDR